MALPVPQEPSSLMDTLQSQEAEAALLGAVLIQPEVLHEVLSIVEAQDFTSPRHRKIWEAFLALHRKNLDIDLVTLREELERMGALEEVGGVAYLAHLMQKVPSGRHAVYYARIVEETAIRRRIVDAASEMVKLAHKQGPSVDELLAEAEQTLFGILMRRMRREVEPLGRVVDEYYDLLTRLAQEEGLIGVATGFSKLDALLKGLQPSELIYVAGRPGMGKTAFLLTVALAAAKRGHTVAVFSLEMSREQVAARLLAQEARVPAERLRMPTQLREEDWARLMDAAEALGALPFFLDDTPALNPLQLRAKCRRIQAEYGLGLVVVDYIQLMTAGVRTENRVQEVSYISRMLKHLARDLNVPVLAAAQLSRAVEHRADKRPMLADLRESGSLEQDADVVLFLYRPEVYRKEKEPAGPEDFPGKTEVIVAKNRSGPTDTIELTFKPEFAAFQDAPTRRDLNAL